MNRRVTNEIREESVCQLAIRDERSMKNAEIGNENHMQTQGNQAEDGRQRLARKAITTTRSATHIKKNDRSNQLLQ